MVVYVTHLTSAHQRFDVRIYNKECLSLSHIKNYQINLVVADNKGDEIKDNIHIYDVGTLAGRFNRMFKTTKRVLKKAIELDSDIYHFHDPELIPIGLKLKKLGKIVIFDIHENTDLQILEREWIPIVVRKPISIMFSKYEKYACKKFDYLLVPQVAMYEKFAKINNTEVIGNFPHSDNINVLYDKQYSKYKLLYSGSITESRGLFNMLNLLLELVKINKKYSITIAGSMSQELLEKAKNHDAWESIEYLGYLSQENLKKVYHEHSIGLIMFNNVGQYYMAYSLKLFEYMQNGLTIVMPNFGDWIHFNKVNDVGYNIDVKNSETIAKVINDITLKSLETNAIKNNELVKDKFSWKNEENKLYKIYEKVINANKI